MLHVRHAICMRGDRGDLGDVKPVVTITACTRRTGHAETGSHKRQLGTSRGRGMCTVLSPKTVRPGMAGDGEEGEGGEGRRGPLLF